MTGGLTVLGEGGALVGWIVGRIQANSTCRPSRARLTARRPREWITAEVIAYLRDLHELTAAGRAHGVTDPSFATVRLD
jgi:hypothetical protein